jgi:hypothetical protein
MKNLVLIFVVFSSFSLFAQDDSNNAVVNNAADEWIVKISSDSKMRVEMMDMIIVKTKGNEAEMRKIANSISNDTGLYQMIVGTFPGKASSENLSIEPLGISKDSIKVGIVYSTKLVPVPKK